MKASSAVLIAITVGTIGFKLLSINNASLFDCFYMTIITLSTVGYSEVVELDTAGHLFASVLILMGMGALIYFGSTIVALWVETDLQQVRRRKKMQKAIDALRGHVIVCGCGTTGSRVVEELMDTQTPFVMVDSNLAAIDATVQAYADSRNKGGLPLYINGDATEDKILFQAGIERASGLVAALRNDKDNLYLIFSSRQLNPGLRIVARAMEKDAPKKMIRAGANRVVAPNILGGMRIASEMIRPDVTEFLDIMLRDREQNHRIEQVKLPPDSPLIGRTLSDSRIRKATDILVIAIRDPDGAFEYNPGPETILREETTLVVLGAVDSILKLRKSLHASTLISIAPGPGQ
ncbi:MAG: potassium channel protein [Deltaproteobacteria bacterium]|nr:potassium channel protein [Deltaproteobacteria bacterium]